jgi:hypothetical protein
MAFPPRLLPTNPLQPIQQSMARASTRLDTLSKLFDERADQHVRFDFPSTRPPRDHSFSTDGAHDHFTPTPITIHHRSPTQPPEDHILRSIFKPVAKVVRDLKPRQPTQPTVYIVTFSADTVLTRPKNVARLLDTQLPVRNPPVPHLYTIDARDYVPPPQRICERYSGISPVVQDIVMQDRRARRAVSDAVQELVAFGMNERQKVGGKREVSMSVCCHMGTHRSVAIGERIAQGVKAEVGRLGLEEGVRVIVRHVHRVKGRKDPF